MSSLSLPHRAMVNKLPVPFFLLFILGFFSLKLFLGLPGTNVFLLLQKHCKILLRTEINKKNFFGLSRMRITNLLDGR